MKEVFRLVRVFLASPGDLSEERRLIKETEQELNNGIASYLGFRIELKGWEDTLSTSGRPQAVINKELDNCELFIGMMYRKWGTPPSDGGKYTSGFEEEFTRSSLRREKTGKPEMAMYFKAVDASILADPGEDLKKVIEFKDRIASERSILYEIFDNPYSLQQRVRMKINNYLIELKAAEAESLEEEKAKSRSTPEEANNEQVKKPISSPFSAEGYEFLKSFLGKTEVDDSGENITSLDVARFRLLSSAITKPGNNESFLGVHDANIIYLNKDVRYGATEVLQLIDCALKNISHENAPLWHWSQIYKETAGDNLFSFRSLHSDENISVGSLKAMNLIGSTLPVSREHVDRYFFINHWLSEDRADNIKLAALNYLKNHGKDKDLPLIQAEFDREDSKTSRIALEAIISIQSRYSKSQALKTVFENQFESLDEVTLENVLSAPFNLNEEILRSGLNHRCKRIRLVSFKKLCEEKKIDSDELEDLKKDSYAYIRKEVVDYVLSTNQHLSDEEIKSILIKPKKQNTFFGLSQPGYDQEGEALYENHLISKYSKMPRKDLLELTKNTVLYNEIPYIALCSHYFKNQSQDLRKAIDDNYSSKFKQHMEYLNSTGLKEDFLENARNVEDFLRRKFTRKSLDVLCKKGDIKDLHRIRKNMRSDYVKSSEAEIEYMRKHGEWEDIHFILEAEKDSSSTTLTLTIDDDWNTAIVKAAYSIGKDRIDDLLNIKMSPQILSYLIKICSSLKFSEISDETLMKLLNSKEDKVRKFTSLKCIQSLKKSKLGSLLKKYVGSNDYRYYNVIYWLDFGVTMSKPISKKAISIAFKI